MGKTYQRKARAVYLQHLETLAKELYGENWQAELNRDAYEQSITRFSNAKEPVQNYRDLSNSDAKVIFASYQKRTGKG